MFQDDGRSIDFQPGIEENHPPNTRTLNLTERCNDRFYINNDSTLVVVHTKRTFKANQFCIELNGKAETKYDHVAKVYWKHDSEWV